MNAKEENLYVLYKLVFINFLGLIVKPFLQDGKTLLNFMTA